MREKLKELTYAVAQMRQYQKLFFEYSKKPAKQKTPQDWADQKRILEEAKKQEKLVDEMVTARRDDLEGGEERSTGNWEAPYVILSLAHSNGNTPTWWRKDNAGYVNSPFYAGFYTEEQVKDQPDYYNNGRETLAVRLTEMSIEEIGLSCTMNLKKVKALAAKREKEVSDAV